MSRKSKALKRAIMRAIEQLESKQEISPEDLAPILKAVETNESPEIDLQRWKETGFDPVLLKCSCGYYWFIDRQIVSDITMTFKGWDCPRCGKIHAWPLALRKS